MMIRPPRSPRETLQLLSYYDPERGLEALLDRVDWSAASPRQIYHAVLGRLPESARVAVAGADYSARGHMASALRSTEFQSGILRLVLDAFPEKRRLLFVHVPKCAGTDLTANLRRLYPSLHQTLSERSWAAEGAFLDAIREVVFRLGFAEHIFVCGHIPLAWYLDERAYRFGDRLFTTVRDPVGIVLSHVNYVTQMLAGNPHGAPFPDITEWFRALGIEDLPDEMPEGERRELARRVLRNRKVTGGEVLCRFLGAGTAESALDRMAVCDIEITDTARYPAWLEANWGIVTRTRENASQPLLTRDTLTPEDRECIMALTEEDRKLHDRIAARLGRTDALSIRGAELA